MGLFIIFNQLFIQHHMKNIIVVTFLISALPVFAQIPQGSSTIGGNISFLRQKDQLLNETTYSSNPYYKTEYKYNILSVTPNYGYFVINNLCIGANVSATFTHASSAAATDYPELENHSRSIGVGPFVRYYLPLDNKLYAFVTTGYTWYWSNLKYEFPDATDDIVTMTSKSRYTLWNGGIGLSYFINPSAALEAGAGYASVRHKNDDGKPTDKTNNIALNIGFRIFLRKAS